MAAEVQNSDIGIIPSDSIQNILNAAAHHNLQSLERLVNETSFPDCKAVDVQDPATGFSPLHATIYGSTSHANGTEREPISIEERAIEIVKFLLENGAIWNQLDRNDETPGCLAYRLGLESLYQLIVDAGVRAEMLLTRLEEYERLDESEEGDILEDDTAPPTESVPREHHEVNSSTYLSSTLSRSGNMLLDEQQNGVMMAWESNIMLKSADALLPRSGLQILNIGFGMGILDTHIQNHANKPANHHIVEAHSEVLSEMQATGWMDKPGVVIHKGRWQDVLPAIVAQGVTFDAIYFDTFAESYGEFREFVSEQVISLLDQEGRWSFFNGMGADRQISYDVYQKVVELDLFESGFDVDWDLMELPKLDAEWEGVRRKYWNVNSYRLPICKFME
ncbi:uncharacterized protein A1O9_04934 [Exophiala aquamarina CBS 119918]|uniref:Arginine N-methyltransferase 2 n=1 Tax=Exophiala aquamarina CBS 119918 TaxID=1182545 RepID=A0A072PIX2_9EURO|nr:uncharacterized protein A1O9_04934 [Exophiala aquamarina CBS 119918]KEF60084.1 hypothetical protein A1O9_04934 [Exophiala aquamarina CBS 119918]